MDEQVVFIRTHDVVVTDDLAEEVLAGDRPYLLTGRSVQRGDQILMVIPTYGGKVSAALRRVIHVQGNTLRNDGSLPLTPGWTIATLDVHTDLPLPDDVIERSLVALKRHGLAPDDATVTDEPEGDDA